MRLLIVLLITATAWPQQACVRSLSPFAGSECGRVVSAQFEKRGFNMHECGQAHETFEVWFYAYSLNMDQGPMQFWLTSARVGNVRIGSISTLRPKLSGVVWTVVWVKDWEPVHRQLSPSLGSASKGIAKWIGHTQFATSVTRN